MHCSICSRQLKPFASTSVSAGVARMRGSSTRSAAGGRASRRTAASIRYYFAKRLTNTLKRGACSAAFMLARVGALELEGVLLEEI